MKGKPFISNQDKSIHTEIDLNLIDLSREIFT